ncbi:MAG: hypothetical protein JWQ94_4937, partial [Tardiphaga sp.]|nr:hypothetical protein [Tardiphaga sp.]
MLRNDNPSDDELLRYAGTVLQLRTDTDPHAATELAELASFHDELRPTQQNFLAAHFLDVLHNQLRLDSLDEVGVNILSLTDPYFVRSDHRAAAELLISSAFAEAEWHRRSFEDLVVIGSALAELAYSASGAKDLWRRFYQRFAGDSE